MSVRANDRGQHELEVINYSRQLTQYTYERVRGGVFPKADRWIMAKYIWDEIANAHAKIIRANAIRVETAEDAARRLLMEKEAIGHLDAAVSLIDICNVVGLISDDRADFWTGLATKTQNFAKAWLKSDRQAYKPLLVKLVSDSQSDRGNG